MPTREENRAQWTDYGWSDAGDDWSKVWGSSRTLWFGTILPRIHFLLPARRLLEIAPGFGRVTAFLLEHCEEYTGVDLTPKCVEACRQRFAGRKGARFVLNDGHSLDAVADDALDAAVSWDSLVHADPGVMEAYVHGLRKKLVPGGRAFLHHSNLGAFLDASTGEPSVPNPHWRDKHMSAEHLRGFARDAGLSLDGQLLVQVGGPVATDCFSWLRRPRAGEAPCCDEDVHTHPSFGAEIDLLGWTFRHPGRGQA